MACLASGPFGATMPRTRRGRSAEQFLGVIDLDVWGALRLVGVGATRTDDRTHQSRSDGGRFDIGLQVSTAAWTRLHTKIVSGPFPDR